MRTPPPAVPGIAAANSNPPSPASRARCSATAFGAPPPATSTSPLHLGRDQIAGELENERVDAVVVREHVRAQPDRLDGHLALLGPAKRLLELVDRPRAGEPAGGAAGPDRRVARERNALFHAGHASGAAGRQRDRRRRRRRRAARRPAPPAARAGSAPCSTVGVYAASTPRSLSASITSLPLTPATGCSRAA